MFTDPSTGTRLSQPNLSFRYKHSALFQWFLRDILLPQLSRFTACVNVFAFEGLITPSPELQGSFFFLALVTLLQGIYADVESLPQECRCGSICKWLITGKEARWKGCSWWWGSFGHSRGVRAFMMIFSLLITICLPFQNMDVKNSLEAWVGKISSPRARWSDWSFCVNSQVCKTLPVKSHGPS